MRLFILQYATRAEAEADAYTWPKAPEPLTGYFIVLTSPRAEKSRVIFTSENPCGGGWIMMRILGRLD
jgi:hypothetical protein